MSHTRRLVHLFRGALVLAAIAAACVSAQPADAIDAAAAGKSIVVDLSQQKVYAYYSGKVVWSTWANIRGARRGTFRIQNKLPVANSFALGWRLPHWMGIYYAGGLQNGFHGPAYTARGGRAMTSLGCIVMPANAAATLYRWSTIGTRVVIQQ